MQIRENTQPYLQGIVPSIEFWDVAQITDTGGTLQVGTTIYTNVLSTEEWNPDEPDVRQGKFYAPDVGIVQITAINDPEGETLNNLGLRHILVSSSFRTKPVESKAAIVSEQVLDCYGLTLDIPGFA